MRAYAQRDPLNEYKREAFELFRDLLATLREAVTSVLAHVELQVQRPEDLAPAGPGGMMIESHEDPAYVEAMRGSDPGGARANGAAVATSAAPWARTARNAPCPCGSGKKFKHCHGRA